MGGKTIAPQGFRCYVLYAIGVVLPDGIHRNSTFTAALQRHLNDDSYRAMQLGLILRPEQGAIIPGGAGIRKMRWAARDKGKRGGLRVIYYWLSKDQTFYMLYAYSKNEQRDLSRAQINVLAHAVREELK